MQDGMLITALCLTVLAICHSYLGERYLLQPLLRWPNFPRLVIGEPFAKGTLRFAWHLTSLAWLALAVMAVRGECSRGMLAIMLALSGILAHGFTRGGHAAWAVFIVGAVAAATSASTGTFWLRSAAALGALLLSAVGAVHVAWASGVRWSAVSGVPESDGRPLFAPPRLLTWLVALALFATAWLTLALARFVPAVLPFAWLRYAGMAGAAVFALRTIGDLRFVGLFKRVRDTSFARFDDLLFTPLCFVLSTVLVLQLI